MAEEAHHGHNRQPVLIKGGSQDASARRAQFGTRQSSLDNVEHEQAKLSPRVEGRIVVLAREV